MKCQKLVFPVYKSLVLFLLMLGLTALFAIPKPNLAAAENTICVSEPTNMMISYGDAIPCAIDNVGDTDLFRFDGTASEVIIIQVVWTGGAMRPCIELIAPDNSRLQACANAFTNRIDTTLTQTGTYTVLVDVFFGGTGDYVLALERLIEPSPNAQVLQFGKVVTGEINPVGDLDLYVFEGTTDDNILLTISWLGGSMRPCLQLIYPDNTRETACNNAFSNQFDITLDQTGPYAVLTEVFFGGTGNYTLELQCITGECLATLDNLIYLPMVIIE